MKRKPVGVAAVDLGIVVVCDDGSMWMNWAEGGGWQEFVSIPGSQRAEEREESFAAIDREYTKA